MAQTLPIEVDRGAGGRPPFVTVGPNGVPIVNIAPPGAGGVSANHYKQFNVGPSGVVLNNSGLGSGSVLAGGVPGNPMLGNSHATTILNQVTTNNPSLLRGLMEVAGHRANVIVANPAGITCDGCGFINSNRGTFTTGTALLGPGGVAGFDITRGRLAFEGQGLQGEALSRVDLYARAVVLNAAVWANYLDVVAGAADIGYQDGSVAPKDGVGERPSFSIDMGALGSMYANGIRMKGTEAGLGVNMGGNIEAYTGEVHMDVNGSLRLQPSAQLHAARLALRGSDINLAGALYADQDVTVTAVNDISVDDLIDAKGNAFLQGRNILLGQSAVATAGLNLHIDAAGQLRSLGTIRADGPVTLQSTGATTLSGGTVSDAGGVSVVSTAGDIIFTPSANTRAASGIAIRGARDVNLHGETATPGAITVDAGGKFGSAGKVIVGGPVTLRSTTGAVLSGATVSQGSSIDIRSTTGDIDVTATATAWAAGPINIVGTRDVQLGGATYSAGTVSVDAAEQLRSVGQVVAAGPVVMRSAGAEISGETVSENSSIAITSTVGDVKFGKDALTQAVGPIAIRGARDVHLDGSTSSKGKIALAAARDVSLHGTTSSEGEIDVGAGRDVRHLGTTSSEGGIDIDAGRDVSLYGTTSSKGKIIIDAVQDVRLTGRVEADGGDLLLDAGRNVAVARDGVGKASGDVSVQAGGTLTNEGYLKAGKKGTVRAKGDVNNQGGILSGDDLDVRTPAKLDNTGNLYAGINEKGELALPGNLNLDSNGELVNSGTAAAGGNASLNGKSLRLTKGKVSAIEAARLSSPGVIDTQAASVAGKTVTVNGKSLSNQQGTIYAVDKIELNAAEEISNQRGSIGSHGAIRVSGKNFNNRAGRTAGGAVDAQLSETIDNTAGLIDGDGDVRLQAKRVLNANTKSDDPARRLGILGTDVQIAGGARSAGDRDLQLVDNTKGYIHARDKLTITAGAVNNTRGRIYASNLVDIIAKDIANEAGEIRSGKDIKIVSDLSGAGTVHAGRDLDVTFRSDNVNHTGQLLADRHGKVQAPGHLINGGTISARDDSHIKARELTNLVNAEILAGGRNFFDIQQRLHNGGLIDGGLTYISVPDVFNTGRIYGVRGALNADHVRNVRSATEAEAGVIASREDLDMGVKRLDIGEDALIYAGGRIAIGGQLDDDLRAVGKAEAVDNASGLMESEGDAKVSADRIDNRNLRYAASEEMEEVSRRKKVYYRLNGSTEELDPNEYWLCDQVTPECSKDHAWLGNDRERRLFKPSKSFQAKYPESRYGPPFSYAKAGWQRAKIDAPIGLAYDPAYRSCTSDHGCEEREEKFHYPLNARIWTVFGVPAPAEPTPEPVMGKTCSSFKECGSQKLLHHQSRKAFLRQYETLNARIGKFNRAYARQLVRDFNIFEVEETVSENRTLSTKPGRILAGGNAAFEGKVVNDKSQILAGGRLDMLNGAQIENIDAIGKREVKEIGTAISTFVTRRWRKYETAPHEMTVGASDIPLKIVAAEGYARLPHTGAGAPGASALAGLVAPISITSVELAGGQFVRTAGLPTTVPLNKLYRVNARADAPYLVATDARFLGSRPRLSSDFLFQRLAAVQPAPTGYSRGNSELEQLRTLKRLGDGFYEQKYVTDQIMAATGQRFVGDYRDNEAQYKALLAAGAEYASRFGVSVGTPLTAAHMRELTTDMVWLVKQEVTLADGSKQTVLAPQVYLVMENEASIGTRTLMAGRDVRIETDGDLLSSGAISARDNAALSARDIRILSPGLVRADIVDLSARQDIHVSGGEIRGNSVKGSAVRDVRLSSTTGSAAWSHDATPDGGAARDVVSTRSSYVRNTALIAAVDLLLVAGRNLDMTAASVVTERDADLRAAKDIRFNTENTSQETSIVFNKRNTSAFRTSSEQGTSVQVGGDLSMVAGHGVAMRSAEVHAEGRLSATAGHDIDIHAGEASGYARDERVLKYRSGWTRVKEHYIDEGVWTQAQPSTVTANEIAVKAGDSVDIVGSDVGAVQNLSIVAGQDVTITGAENTFDDYHHRKTTRSGWGALGGISHGTKKKTETLEGERVSHTASTVGSVQGDVTIDAGGKFSVEGSNVLALEGDVRVKAKDVVIATLTDTDWEKHFHEVRAKGFYVSLDSPILDTMRSLERMDQASGKTDNKIMKSLSVVTRAMAIANLAESIPSDGGASMTITVNYGGSRTTSVTERGSSTAIGSILSAGKNLELQATGAGANSNILVEGSTLSGGNDVALAADGAITLKAAANTHYQHTETSSTDASVGVGVTAGVSNGSIGYGAVFKFGVAASEGTEDGKGLSWTNSSVAAKNLLSLKSGGDTSFVGASGKGERIDASVGGNLLFQSLQDENTFKSRNQSATLGGTFCAGYCSSSAYASYSRGAMKSNFASVMEQTGLWAGDGGFQIDVGKATKLVGSVIASSDQAVAEGKNRLHTGTLETEDIENKAEYFGYQVGASASVGSSSGGKQAGGGTIQSNSRGGANAPTIAAAFDRERSTTYSAISGGDIVIRDATGQKALTGKASERMLAALNHDTEDAANSLSPIFDKEKIEANFAIMQELQGQASTFIARRVSEADAVQKELKAEKAKGNAKDPAVIKALTAKYDMLKPWLPGGNYRLIATSLIAGVSGNVAAPAASMVLAAGVNALQGLGAQQIKELAPHLGGEGSPAHIALHAVLACAGGAAQGGQCGAGAAGASASIVFQHLLNRLNDTSAEKLTPTERENRLNLLGSLLAGVGSAMDAGAVAQLTGAARIEAENNALTVAQNQTRIAEMVQCQGNIACEDGVVEKYREINADHHRSMVACSGGQACVDKANEVKALQAEYSDRISALNEILKKSGGLSSSQQQEWAYLHAVAVQLEADRTQAIYNALMARDSPAAKQLAIDSVAQAVGVSAAGVAAGINSAVGARSVAAKRTPQAVTNASTGSKIEKDIGTSVAAGNLVESGAPVSVKGGNRDGLEGASPGVPQPYQQPPATGPPQGARAVAANDAGDKRVPLLPHRDTRVLTEKEARALGGENKGLIYVAEGPRGKQTAQDFQAGTAGAFSDLATGKQGVPALRYNNSNAKGVNFVKFDGIQHDADGKTVLLIDAKTKLATWSASTQRAVIKTIRRVEEALNQNPGFRVVYEFPNTKVEGQARSFIRDNQLDHIISTRVRTP
ncbi:hemagglutinin repeat-containing protein [Bordetella sp. LUAb4]|uniref:two-partner secretion domain-containing protein n=1 Tax=Bordetella sp. LUAb4 TaxID=2843195 RepID=UPI001E3C9261|nr:hemagglutinin repeat-containing protein [Bordetella sp. LUAb4]